MIFVMTACLPHQEELNVMLNKYNITKKIYIKNDVNGYNTYGKDKEVIQVLKRGKEYNIVDIKENYVRLRKSKNNNLKSDVWVTIDEIETQPTYFITLLISVPNSEILLNNKKYNSNLRFPRGVYTVDVSADNFLDKRLNFDVSKDTIEEITLDFDIEAQKYKMEKEKKQRERIEKERIRKEEKKSIYIDKKQKLMWQDNSAVLKIKKSWLTKTNYDGKNYFNIVGDTAMSYCKNLTLAKFKDWRLPTKDELKNLSTQKDKLKNISSNWYWSATSNNNNSERAWSIYFDNGDGYSDLKNASNYVRCIRDGIQ
ncbi:DUF1566 domain-containing protein [Arcobacter sp. F2176]|uniref:Lcl C-terminal domain-containing protein n=1 Tax=Arcobacter sp. F2176 TaxID=2044511 RepID=UPI00100A9026|nr:DUF1566 domain-containing protein [Arcobacter sp. F2176]